MAKKGLAETSNIVPNTLEYITYSSLPEHHQLLLTALSFRHGIEDYNYYFQIYNPERVRVMQFKARFDGLIVTCFAQSLFANLHYHTTADLNKSRYRFAMSPVENPGEFILTHYSRYLGRRMFMVMAYDLNGNYLESYSIKSLIKSFTKSPTIVFLDKLKDHYQRNNLPLPFERIKGN